MIRPIALYACETWATTKTDEQNLARFERKVLRQIFGPRRNQNTGEYERRKNEEGMYGEAESRQLVKSPTGSRRAKDHSAAQDKD
ncbi:Uncharacterized protein FWK35_00023272, partial [Aphis craccivora]